MSPTLSGNLAFPRRVVHRSMFTVCAFLLALPLAALGAFPMAAFAHPAHTMHVAAPTTGKTASPALDLTLHYHSTLISGLSPTALATDVDGNTYVADATSDTVKEYDANDTFVRSFGSGQGSGNGQFYTKPAGVISSGGDVFVADPSGARVETFDQTTGTYINSFGNVALYEPYGLAISSGVGQVLFITDPHNSLIIVTDYYGNYLATIGGFGTGNGQFNTPLGIAFNPVNRDYYVADSGNDRIEVFNLSYSYVTQWGSGVFSSVSDVAVDRAGMVYVTDPAAHTIYKFDPNGSLVGSYAAPATTPFVHGTFDTIQGLAVRSAPNKPLDVYAGDAGTGPGHGFVQRFDQVVNPQAHTYQSQIGSAGSGNGQFSDPWGVAMDAAGNVYVTDANNNRVEKFDRFGNFLLAFGTYGVGGNGTFRFPEGIAVSPDGTRVYVTDTYNFRVEVFDSSGNYQSQFGSYGMSGNGMFNDPGAIATDGTHLYVADTGNNRIQVFSTSGVYQYQFGTVGYGNPNFNGPTGIAVDIARQELFIADSLNNRIQAYTTGGTFVASLTSIGAQTIAQPYGVSTDQRGDVYVSERNGSDVGEFDVNLIHSAVFGSGGTGNGQFGFTYDVAVNPVNGQIYAVDNTGNRVEVWGSPWPKNDTIGIYRPSTKTFYLRNANTTGPSTITVPVLYAQAGDLPIVGDWNGDGVDTVGLYRPSTGNFFLQDANVQETSPDYVFTLGIPGDTPIAGDWNGQGADGAGIFRPSNGILYLKNTLATGFADYNLVLGIPGDKGIAGDWNGDGQDSPGVYRPSNQTFYVTNKVTNGVVTSDHSAVLGISGDAPFTGDWVAQGSSGIGVFRPSNGITYEKNQVSTGFADNNFIYGIAGDVPVAGQWIEPSVPFSAAVPHVSLGTHGSASASPPTSGGGHAAPTHSSPIQTPAQHMAATMPRHMGQKVPGGSDR